MEDLKSPSFSKDWKSIDRSARPKKALSRRLSRILAVISVTALGVFTVSKYEPARSSPILYAIHKRYHTQYPITEQPLRNATDTLEDQLPIIQSVSEAYESERQRLLYAKNYDTRQISYALGSPSTSPLDPDLQTYITRLRTFVNAYFPSSPHQPHLISMLDNLELHIPPPVDRPIPKIVMSTCKNFGNGSLDLPEGFGGWEKRLGGYGENRLGGKRVEGEGEGDMEGGGGGGWWEVRVADDGGMEEWFEGLVSGIEGGAAGLKGVWEVLPKKVLKSDLLRYLAVLLHGGIYTDSDTEPRSHPYLWGNDAEDLLPPSLRPLSDVLRSITLSRDMSTPKSFLNHTDSRTKSYADAYRGGITERDVGLVASIEWDAFTRGMGDNWHIGYARSMQVVQWTIMAKPYHPILLDVLETVVRNIERAEEEGRLDGSIGALDLTGPGPFTDALYRYLVIQYGISPLDLTHRNEAAKIGDVILLPEWSFAQPAPREDEWDFTGPDPTTRCVSHGFLGRWKKEGWGD